MTTSCAACENLQEVLEARYVPPPPPEPKDPSTLCPPYSWESRGLWYVVDPKRRAYWQPIIGHLYGGGADYSWDRCVGRCGTRIDPVPPENGPPVTGILEGIDARVTPHVAQCPQREVEPYRAGTSILGGN